MPAYDRARRDDADVELAQLLRRGLRRRAHHQILGALVHREQHDLAQILFPAQQHDDAVDAGRDAAVRRRAERERVQHAAEFLLQHAFVIAGDGESLLHHVRPMVADRAGGKLHAVADDVVLDRLESEHLFAVGGFEREELLGRQVRHGKRIVREVDFLLLLVPLVHRKVDDPAEREPVAVDQPELLADPGARGARELEKLLRLAGDEEDRIAVVQPELLRAAVRSRSGPEVVGDRTAADDGGVVAREKM